MNYERFIATLISRIFDPFVMLAVLFGLLFYQTAIFVPAFLSMIILPFFLFTLAWKTKFISNWDVSDRRERPKVLWTILAIEVVSSILLKTTTAFPELFVLLGFTVITYFWKISGHAMAAALTTGTVVANFGWAWWPVLLIVPLVSWARVVRRDHTIGQVVAGALYSWGVVQLAQFVQLV